jgi:alpha-amylase
MATQVSAAATQTVYFKDSNGWGTVYGYAWDSAQKPLMGSWPGTKLSKDSSGLYKLSVSTGGALNFIFNNGNGGDGNQFDLEEFADGKTYTIVSTAITNNMMPSTSNGVKYNLSGQKVNAGYKGLVIVDGKKVMQK